MQHFIESLFKNLEEKDIIFMNKFHTLYINNQKLSLKDIIFNHVYLHLTLIVTTMWDHRRDNMHASPIVVSMVSHCRDNIRQSVKLVFCYIVATLKSFHVIWPKNILFHQCFDASIFSFELLLTKHKELLKMLIKLAITLKM